MAHPLIGQRYFRQIEFARSRGANLTTQTIRQQLMPKTDAKIRAIQIFHPTADCCFFGSQPGVSVLFPHIHRAAQDDHNIELIQIWDLIACIKFYDGGLGPVGLQVTRDGTRTTARRMLKNNNAGHCVRADPFF
ncbi:hypothetical protein APY04_1259 [Hyphomicrobium sulfonivorans]|uniref:Uncharacterized protein n=1 Tax=Hyphomicrobium sulfonivorans TaxID=121290 RepID=A0A120CWX0_HYPSL|nr:hypothetical protein APY04_1259 [Hyphomicrobium sulfonivorans]